MKKQFFILILIVLTTSKCIDSHEIQVTDNSSIFYGWFLTSDGSEADIPPNVLWDIKKCGEKIILTQIPDTTSIGNVLYMKKKLYETYPDEVYSGDFIDSLQLSIIMQNPVYRKAYEMDTAYWIYSENPIKREGPYSYKELIKLIDCK